MATVLEYLLRCGTSDEQANTHLAAGHVRVNGVPVQADFPMPDSTDDHSGEDRPSVAIHPY